MAKRIAAVLAVYLLLAGCASKDDAKYQREGVQYGTTKGTFHGRWWNYYERGTSFLAGKYYDEALKDFRVAIAARGGDSWRARTYGLHFVEYFPNREIGVTLFEQGNLDEAEKYLGLSLQQMDTERAHYYLDKVKKARLANGSLKDNEDPTVDTTIGEEMVIASNLPPVGAAPMSQPAPEAKPEPAPAKEAPKPAAKAPAPKPVAKKAAPAPTPVEKPVAAAKPAPKPAEKPAPAPKTVAKAEPKPVEAPKPAAKPEAKPVEAAKPVETPKPVEAAKPAAPAPAEKPANLVTEPIVPIEVATKDDVGVIKVAVNGRQLPQRGSAQQLKFRDDIQLKEGAQKIEVVATDLADKQTKKTVNVVLDMTGPTIGVFSPIEPTVTPEGAVTLDGASTDKVGVATVAVGDRRIADSPGAPKLPFNTSLPLGNGENIFVLAAKDTGGNETRSAVKVFRGDPNSRQAKLWLLKQKRPDLFLFASNGTGDLDELLRVAQNDAKKRVNEIRLKSPSVDKPYRLNRTLRISGDVFTDSAVQSLSINGEPVNEISGAPKESFNKRIAIDPAMLAAGKMDISIVAMTTKGDTMEKKFMVELAPIDIATAATRMPVAVLAFAGKGIDAAVGEQLRAQTEAQMAEQNRFAALDRAALKDVLNEQQLASAYGNPEEALAIGKATGAQVFLVADLFTQDEKGLEIKARAVDSETANLVGTLDVFIDDKTNADLVKDKCADLVAQLAKLYPRVSGEVTTVSGNQIVIDMSQSDGIRPGAYVVLLTQTESWTDPVTGEVLEPGELREAGRARVDSVSATSVRATMIQRKEEGAPVEQGMPAITM